MVKTRISCSLENDMSKSLSGMPRNGPRVSLRRSHVMYNQYKEDEDEEESDESGYAAVPPKDRIDRHSKFEEDKEEVEGTEEEEEEEQEEEADEEEEEEEENEEEDDNCDQDLESLRMKIRTRQDKSQPGSSELVGNSIRRSTRQRKPIYDTLNQSWLLGSSRLRDFTTTLPNVMVHPSREVVSNSQKITQEEEESNSLPNDLKDYSDMYSRVKRERQKPKQSVYRTDKGKGVVDSSEEDDEGDDEEESSLDGIKSHSSKYCLRQTKPVTNRFQVPVAPVRNPKAVKSMLHVSSPPRRMCKRFEQYISPACKDRAWKKRRRATHHTSSSSSHSSSSSSGDEKHFDRRKAKSMTKARNRCLPLNLNAADVQSCGIIKDRIKIGSSLADVDPMSVDREVNFESVGGLSEHLQSLKEMIIFPLLYPEVFDRFKISPPRGVLFYGPPGTGKTLVARALANECSQEDKRVAFFMRKGADCLSKWVGESERQLRLLFDQAYAMRPSIIFFDEIDGLAPVRSSRQDQIHSSIVSTLLALMDGLDSRGEVVVVGATNRLDAIDPALRRPGRFDREFSFPLPSVEGRRRILEIHTGRWEPRLRSAFVSQLAEKTVGYCGADLKALCAEAALLALRRRYPQIYTANAKLQLDVNSIEVSATDFWRAMRRIVPSAHRCAGSSARALSPVVRPLLRNSLARAVQALQVVFPEGCTNQGCDEMNVDRECVDDVEGDIFDRDNADSMSDTPPVVETNHTASISHRPRLLLCGMADQGQTSHLAPAILHHLEHLPVHRMDLPALFGVTARAPEEACAQILSEARRVLPSIVYLPHVDQWWATVSDTVRVTFLTLLHDMDPSAPILLLATSDCPYQQFPTELQQLFNVFQGELLQMKHPSIEERREFFSQILLVETRKRPRSQSSKRVRAMEELPLAPPPKRRTLNETERSKLVEDEESTLRELRQFLRDILYKLARDRRFTIFTKPVNVEEVPDYLEVIRTPMDLEKMMTKIDLHKYETVKEFLQDVDLICQNALEYNPDRDPTDKLIRHRACALRDTAHSLIDAELDPEFELMCQEVQKSRVRRGESPSRFAPKNYNIVRPDGRPLIEERQHLSPIPESLASSESTPSTSTMRFSRRIRGLGAPEPKGSPTETHDKTEESPKTHVVVRRRRSSLWFGCNGRKYITRTLIQNGEVQKKTRKNRRNGHMQLNSDNECEDDDKDVVVIHKVNGLHADKATVNNLITECDVRLEVDAAVEAMLLAVCKEPEVKPAAVMKEVIVDVSKLEELTDLAVSVTESCSVETLEKFYCVLSRRVVGYKSQWDRSSLVKELEADIEVFRRMQRSARDREGS